MPRYVKRYTIIRDELTVTLRQVLDDSKSR